MKSSSPSKIVYGHIAMPVPDLQVLRPDIPDAISGLVKKLMSKNTEDRYQTAAEPQRT